MIELKLAIEEVNIILQGLQELPAKYSMPLILKIQEQGKKQVDEIKKQ